MSEYRKKRNFAKTPEPAGRLRALHRGRTFVVQKHSASHLHYEFRLEVGGVLASWAIPKGPSMNPRQKRLALRTENHPLEYATFEGVIPEGEYGAGVVMVWDKGDYRPQHDESIEVQLANGKIEFVLDGVKLRGGFALIQIAARSGRRDQGDAWLLIKQKDEFAATSWNIEQASLDRSVMTGRTLEEIAEGRSRRQRGP
nr:DNA polymerase ligase N-terminal domain-containing protein [Rhodoplanes elegans]